MLPFSSFMKLYTREIKEWWDTFGPSNWGATSDETAAGMAIGRIAGCGEPEPKRQSLHMAGWPGRDHKEADRTSSTEIW